MSSTILLVFYFILIPLGLFSFLVFLPSLFSLVCGIDSTVLQSSLKLMTHNHMYMYELILKSPHLFIITCPYVLLSIYIVLVLWFV